MLDLQRAKNGRIKMNNNFTDILRDILEPAAAILCVRGTRVNILTECPQDLFVSIDQLRLKQIILNLAVNSSKFCESGFVRIGAACVDGNVILYVEDSRPGVPIEKRDKLFDSFQDSMDLLSQGTGVGLSVRCFKTRIRMDDIVSLLSHT